MFFSFLRRPNGKCVTRWRPQFPTAAIPFTTSMPSMRAITTSSSGALSRSSSFRRGVLPSPLPSLFLFSPPVAVTTSPYRMASVFASSLPLPPSTLWRSMAARPPGASPASEVVVPRGRRRKNFADADELREWQQQQSGTPSTVTGSSLQREYEKDTTAVPFPFSGPSSLSDSSTAMASPYAASTSSSSSSSLFSSFVSSHPRWWVRWCIRCMWVPYVGAVTAKCCEWSAWVLYLGGKMVFYSRASPVTSLPASDSAATPILPGSGPREGRQLMEKEMGDGASLSPTRSSPLAASTDGVSCHGKDNAAWVAMRESVRQANALYVGRSAIHGRGIFTAVALPKGTRLPLSGWWSPSSSSSPAVFHPLPRCFLPSPSHTLLFSDTYDRLPDTLHYTHPTGKLLEVLFSQGDTALPSHAAVSSGPASFERGGHCLSHVFLNHSCEASVCSGLSKCFWAAALAADSAVPQGAPKEGTPPSPHPPRVDGMTPAADSSSPSSSFIGPLSWATKMREFSGFEDANAFFTTRDIRAHEELTIDYGCRMAPLYASRRRQYGRRWQKNGVPRRKASYGSSSGEISPTSFTLCRCGSPSCRYRLYQPPPPLPHEWSAALRHRLSHLSPSVASGVPTFGEAFPSSLPLPQMPQHGAETRMGRFTPWTPTEDFCAAVELLARGYDDECTLLSLLPTSTSLLQYLSGKTLSALHCPLLSSVAPPPPSLMKAKYSKSDFLLSYRYLFHGLNTLAPENVE